MSLRHKLVKLYEIEALRYRKKGILNIIIAITLLFSVFWGASSFCKNYWPEEINNSTHFLYFRTSFHFGNIILYSFCVSNFVLSFVCSWLCKLNRIL